MAAALVARDGRVLLQRRRIGSPHGGLWEFPGGKIEAGESPEIALLREIDEELGIALDPTALRPVMFASDPAMPPASRARHLILLYRCDRWRGEPECRDAEAIAWFPPDAITSLAMPPLDYPLARALIAAI